MNSASIKPDSQPLVSVVMPSLNHAQFIEEAIDSVLQPANSSVELIVMDGGSTDKTLEILRRKETQYPGQIRWSSKPDGGPASAINRGFGMARGELLGWLNADDCYAKGAIERAIHILGSNNDWIMLYGQGRHVSESGELLGEYPTLPPETPIAALGDGCFICQPTVFMRRELVEKVGGLDESLLAAFDFDWWFRIFGQMGDKIGFVDHLQAYSRLHQDSITLGDREQVIKEGMQVIARYLGHAPLHWFRTYMDEYLGRHPAGPRKAKPKRHLKAFARQIRSFLSRDDVQRLNQLLISDRRLAIARADACLDIEPDGWLTEKSQLRIACTRKNCHWVEIKGRNPGKTAQPIELSVIGPSGEVSREVIGRPGRFVVRLKLPGQANIPGQNHYQVKAIGSFIPREHESGSTDGRALVCQIERIRWGQ